MYFMSHFDDKPWLKVIDKTGCSEALELEDVTKLPIMSLSHIEFKILLFYKQFLFIIGNIRLSVESSELVPTMFALSRIKI